MELVLGQVLIGVQIPSLPFPTMDRQRIRIVCSGKAHHSSGTNFHVSCREASFQIDQILTTEGEKPRHIPAQRKPA